MKKLIFTIAASLLIITSTFAQNPITETGNKDIKTQLKREWEFHELTIRTPKDGYLMHIADQEINLMKLFIANYTFNKDGSITLSPKYNETIGVKEAKWEIDEYNRLVITYFFTEDSKANAGNTNNSEKFKYKIDTISDKELTINMQDMFIVNLKSK